MLILRGNLKFFDGEIWVVNFSGGGMEGLIYKEFGGVERVIGMKR